MKPEFREKNLKALLNVKPEIKAVNIGNDTAIIIGEFLYDKNLGLELLRKTIVNIANGIPDDIKLETKLTKKFYKSTVIAPGDEMIFSNERDISFF